MELVLCLAAFWPRRRRARRCAQSSSIPLFSSQSNHQVPTPPRRRTRQGLDEDLHGACSARGSTTVCTAAPARRGRAAVGAGGGGAGRGARALSKDVPCWPPQKRGRGRGVAPAGRRRRPRRPPPPRVAGAQRCAGAATCVIADRRSHRWPTPKTTAATPALPLRADRARRRRRPRALTAAPPAATRFTPHPPVPRARALTSPVNLRFADFSRTPNERLRRDRRRPPGARRLGALLRLHRLPVHEDQRVPDRREHRHGRARQPGPEGHAGRRAVEAGARRLDQVPHGGVHLPRRLRAGARRHPLRPLLRHRVVADRDVGLGLVRLGRHAVGVGGLVGHDGRHRRQPQDHVGVRRMRALQQEGDAQRRP